MYLALFWNYDPKFSFKKILSNKEIPFMNKRPYFTAKCGFGCNRGSDHTNVDGVLAIRPTRYPLNRPTKQLLRLYDTIIINLIDLKKLWHNKIQLCFCTMPLLAQKKFISSCNIKRSIREWSKEELFPKESSRKPYVLPTPICIAIMKKKIHLQIFME